MLNQKIISLDKAVKENATLSCKRAFEIASLHKVLPSEIGVLANKFGIRLVECQLGLFGYKPEKKIIAPLEHISSALETILNENASENRVPCQKVWEIAQRLGLPKMEVSAAFDTKGIKIKPCQLGAF